MNSRWSRRVSQCGGHRCLSIAVGVVVLILLLMPAYAGNNELSVFTMSLFNEANAKIGTEKGDSAPLRQEVMRVLQRNVSGVIAGASGRTSASSQLLAVREVACRELSQLDVLDIAQCYATANGKYEPFASNLAALASARKISLNWKSAVVAKSVKAIYKKLTLLDSMFVSSGISGSFDSEGWTGDVKATWYPLKGTMFLYVMASINDGSGVHNVVLDVVGVVAAPVGAPFARVAKLSGYRLDIGMHSATYVGEWTLPSVSSAAGSDTLFLHGRVKLSVDGSRVTAKIVENVACTMANGESRRGVMEYAMTGTIHADGVVNGTYSVSGPEPLLDLRGGIGQDRTGTWYGKREGNSIVGTLKLGNGKSTVEFSATKQ